MTGNQIGDSQSLTHDKGVNPLIKCKIIGFDGSLTQKIPGKPHPANCNHVLNSQRNVQLDQSTHTC